MKQARSVDRYLKTLVDLGAIDKHTGRTVDGMRARNRYVLHRPPPPGYTGPLSLADLRGRADKTAGRPVARFHAPPQCAPAHPNQTKKNQTNTSSSARRPRQRRSRCGRPRP
ncbi:hypothetical protein [Actinomadura opuntiae]|uniref:hypothetical protein n=1 Tax=Actinomadura sp. OS1-43 TaxID=604315 RepID=UPI00255AF40B|nr:hypothetical protein [Actinomadura sp. OS1-43]MDL4817224.1 hypothetical protein [Actinomadura sp. OS1-43]